MSDTATLSKTPAEIFIGGAGDEHSRLVLSYAEARREKLHRERQVHYLPHWKIAAAERLANELRQGGHPVALIGHSWGGDTAVLVARRLLFPVVVIGADPVAKPVTRITVRDARPASAMFVLHVDAAPSAYDRSDYVKAAGFISGGGLPRIFRQADIRIDTALNHWNFAGMMKAPGADGKSAEGWLQAFPTMVSQTAG